MSPFQRYFCYLALLCSSVLVSGVYANEPPSRTPGHAHGPEPIWDIRLVSQEVAANGKLGIEFEVICLKDDERIFQPTLIEGPNSQWLKSWKNSNQARRSYSAKLGQTYKESFSLYYDPAKIPYSYRRFQIGMVDESGNSTDMVTAYVYFTPYGTVEMWNRDDFETLNRRWDSMQQPQGQTRKWDVQQLDKKSSDLLKAGGPAKPGTLKAKPRRTRSLPGLAYVIPTNDAVEAKNLSRKMDFSGTVEGQIVVNINGSDMNIVDIAVEVWEVDALAGDNFLATGFTGDDGRFSIAFDTMGGLTNETEIYIAIAAFNQSDLIRVRTRLGVIRGESFFRNAPAVFEDGIQRTHDFGRIVADTHLAKPQLLHWANRARQFVDGELPGVLPTEPGDRLDIMLSFVGANQAYFVPGGFHLELMTLSVLLLYQVSPIAAIITTAAALLAISSNDGIYFGEGSETLENTAFHEFGHYLMWHLQAESWINVFEASFANHSAVSDNPNPKISWTEGFATGFSNIVDTWSQADDGEFGSDNIGNYEDQTSGGWDIEDWGSISHGFYSEWNVGCSLYDLWDGPSQVLQDGSTLLIDSDYNDLGVDAVELSFADIVLPLQNHAGTGGFHVVAGTLGVTPGNDQEQFLLTNIVEYHAALLAILAPDCQAMSQVTRLWNENSINNFQGSNFLDGDLLSSDLLAFNRDVQVGTAVDNFSVDVTELRQEADEYNLSNITSAALSLALSDDLLVSGQPNGGSATLFFNGARTYAWQDPANSYSQLAIPAIPPGAELDVELCGNMTLEVREGGALVVGEPGAPAATVRLTSGSTLILGGDNNGLVLAQETTYNTNVSMGTLEINPGSRFVVEAGATLIYNRGGNILLHGETSTLEIYGDIIVSEMANFKPTGDGVVVFGLPDLDGAPNVTVNNQSVIQFLELDVMVLADTYIRPDDNGSVRFLMEHGSAGMGSTSYIHTGIGPLVIRDMNFSSIDGGFHQGIWVNNINHTISEITMAGGSPGIWGQAPTVPLGISDSSISNCTTGILAGASGTAVLGGSIANCSWAGIESVDGIVTAEEVIFELNHQAIYTNRGGGTLREVTIMDGDTGWRADDPATNLEIFNTTFSNNSDFGIYVNSYYVEALLDNVTMDLNQIGLRAEGSMNVRLTCSTFINNVESGITMADGAVLDIGNNAYNNFEGSDVNLTLEDAAVPMLNGGHNRWTTSDAGDFNILGTLIYGTCVCTPGVDDMGNPNCADPWYFSDIVGELSFYDNTFTTPVISERVEIYDAATGECTYLPLISPAIGTCPVVP